MHTKALLNQPYGDEKSRKKSDVAAMLKVGKNTGRSLVIAFHNNNESQWQFHSGRSSQIVCMLRDRVGILPSVMTFSPMPLFDEKYAQCFKDVRSRHPHFHPYM